MENALNLDTVKLAENKKEIVILDQTLLPNQCKYLNISTAGDIWEAIYSLRVRGAPAIGVTGAYAYYVLANQIETEDKDEFVKECTKMMEYINSSRPTAVNLSWALNRMHNVYSGTESPFDERSRQYQRRGYSDQPKYRYLRI